MTPTQFADSDMMIRLRIPQPTGTAAPIPVGFSINARNCTTVCGPDNATVTMNTTQVLEPPKGSFVSTHSNRESWAAKF
jgi:hypothetical protein